VAASQNRAFRTRLGLNLWLNLKGRARQQGLVLFGHFSGVKLLRDLNRGQARLSYVMLAKLPRDLISPASLF